MLTETWLKSEILYSQLGFYNYNIFRCDRNDLTSNCSRCGGVIIIVEIKYTWELILIPYDSVEQVFLLITRNDTQNYFWHMLYSREKSSDFESNRSKLAVLEFERLHYI